MKRITTCSECGIQVLGSTHMCSRRVRVWEVTCPDNPSSYVSAQSMDEAACIYAEEFELDNVDTFCVREAHAGEWTNVVLHRLEIVATDI